MSDEEKERQRLKQKEYSRKSYQRACHHAGVDPADRSRTVRPRSLLRMKDNPRAGEDYAVSLKMWKKRVAIQKEDEKREREELEFERRQAEFRRHEEEIAGLYV
ncbi:hypothetical protein V5O48_014708 [Marasmius crinis-equi]|uniref:Uncharacterized protein n=1 Tax=Marasmius crinis-equi TaxID=585013 RepID=A0ABR3EWW7_9AGAR